MLCERGGIGRVVKSEAVDQADGVGHGPGQRRGAGGWSPTCTASRRCTCSATRPAQLRRWRGRPPRRAGHPARRPASGPRPRKVTPWSSSGRPDRRRREARRRGAGRRRPGRGPAARPDTRWDFVTGTSAATAWTSGLALRLLRRTTTGPPTRSARRWSRRPTRSLARPRHWSRAPAGRSRTPRGPAGSGLPGRAWRLPGLARRRPRRRPRMRRRSCCPATATRAVRSVTNVGHRPTIFTASVTGLDQPHDDA